MGTKMLGTLSYLWKHKLLLFIVVSACTVTLMPFVFDGVNGCVKNTCGFIIGTNYRDGIWFIAVAETAFRTFPFQMPNYAGAALSGYHFLPNLISHVVSYLGIPVSVTFYQIFPIIYFVLLTFILVSLARTIKNNPLFVGVFLFFGYFAIPFTIVTSLYHYGQLRNGMLINTFQTTRLLESIHASFAYIILLGVLFLLYIKKLTIRRKVIIGFFLFILMGIKFYTETLVITTVTTYECIQLLRTKNIRSCILTGLWYMFCAGVGILIFYNPFASSQSTAIFVFSPFATVHHMIESPDLFYMKDLLLARYTLYAHGWGPRLLAIELFSTLLFVAFYFGTRIVGIVWIIRQLIKKSLTQWELSILVSIIIGIILSVTLIQRGDWYNPIQFAVSSAFLMNYFAAQTVFFLFKTKKILTVFFALCIIVITIPSNLVNLGYLQNPNRYVIPTGEMQALAFLKTQKEGSVFTPVFEPDTSYVSAMTGKQTYYNFGSMVETSGIQADERKKRSEHPEQIDFDSLSVQYVYIPTQYEDHTKLETKISTSSFYREIYRNTDAVIYEKMLK